MTTQNLWDAAKAVLRGKFIAIQPYLKKQEKHQIENLTFHLKPLEKKNKKAVRNTNTWILSNRFLNNQQVNEEIKREIKKFLETNDNENTTQNLWDAAKVVLREKFIAIQSYLKKQGKHQIDNLTLQLKQLEKEGKKKSN